LSRVKPPSGMLRQHAEAHAARLPPLLAEAEKLAASVVVGTHGRRQAGSGEEFWQFRNALPGDEWRSIDWRRSARSDAHYIRQQEWQAAQSVLFWIDRAQSMAFASAHAQPEKRARASVLGLALMILLLRAGERVGLIEEDEPPKTGVSQIDRISALLDASSATSADYGRPRARILPAGSRAVFLSDFLAPDIAMDEILQRAADRGVTGALVQILDPIEEAFPFDGRTEFHSIAGSIRFESFRARALRTAYLDRLAARRAELQAACARAGWQYLSHHTDEAAQSALMWLFAALERDR